MFFSFCHERGTKKKILSPHEEPNLRPSDSALRCPTTEPQRLHGKRGLLRSSYDTRVFVNCLPTQENVSMSCSLIPEVRHFLCSFFLR